MTDFSTSYPDSTENIDRMGGDRITGHPNFTEGVMRQEKESLMRCGDPLHAYRDDKSGGIVLVNFDGYALPPSDVRRLLDLACIAAEYYGEQPILDENLDTIHRKQRRREEQNRELKESGKKKKPIAQSLRKKVFERDGYRCQHCGGHHNLTADHIHPESRGGETTVANLQTLCRSCNSAKGARA